MPGYRQQAQERETALGAAERAGACGVEEADGQARCHGGQVNTKAWTSAFKRTKIEDSQWHDFRHTFATWHRQAGTPTCELQRLGGWKTRAMVERCAQVARETLQGAADRSGNFMGTKRLRHKDERPKR